MSLTQTQMSSRTSSNQTASTSTILLTPQKRKRLSSETSLSESPYRCPEDPATTTCLTMHSNIRECRRDAAHSLTDIYKWTFSQSAVAPIRVKHVFEMDHEGHQEEFFWMGRVPCRTVKVVGLVVGIDEFDDMTRYKLDDGTAVIDCDFKHPKQAKHPPTPKTKRHKPTSKHDLPESSKPPPPKGNFQHISSNEPKVFVGAILSVQGRLFQGRGTRYLRVESGGFSICNSANDEPRHWLEVDKLCREYYYLPEPFIIPKIELQPEMNNTASSSNALIAPSSPLSASSPSGTESSRSSTSSPQRPRLRHPSRLHSRDLTDVTFRIYVKHYMDFAPPYLPSRSTLSDDDDDQSARFGDPCATPTPKGRYKPHSSPLATPKPRKVLQVVKQSENQDVQYGFMLGYLRRVPVLAEMAHAVVRAEGKRREGEKRKREKAKGVSSQRTQGSSYSTASSSLSKSSGSSNPMLVSRNMKRLFQKTIRDLYKDGSIVIWNGHSRPCEHASHMDDNSFGLWKASAKSVSLLSTASTQGSVTACGPTQDDDVAAYLSDPDPQEESYLPITAQTLSPFVMHTLRILTGIQDSSRAGSRRHRPPTVGELTLHLQQSDAQWTNLGSWDVQAALEWLQNEDRVFKAGDGRWAVCR